jgi:drug/metabolite transporter (DMT)-like permease
MSSHLRAVLQALFVTFLWSTSWVLIKTGLKDIPPLTFAGLRYMLAFLCLVPLVTRGGRWQAVRQLSRREWIDLIVLGLLYYAVTQGTQFLGLDRLPALTTSLLLSFTVIVTALLGVVMLAEFPTRMQWFGVGLYLAGVLVYFYPVSIPTDQVIGLILVLTGVFTNSLSAVLGREINQRGTISPLTVTIVSMGIGAVVILAAGIIFQGLPALSLQNWAIIAWLAVVNTAFAFTLWNLTQRTLPAIETSIINNTMLIQIAVLAWIFLDERLSWREIGGLILAGVGTLIVQLWRSRPVTPVEEPVGVAIQDGAE